MPSSPSPNLSQFNLRTLFVGVTLFAVVFAAAAYGGRAGLLAASALAVLISAHVIGNALGTRLRDEVSPQLNPKPSMPPPFVRARVLAVERRLHERTPLGRLIYGISAGAALVGAVLGGLAMGFWTSASLAGWLVGTLSSALLGAFFGFLLASFLEMAIRAWWQASQAERGKGGDSSGGI